MSESKLKTGEAPAISEEYLADFRGYVRTSSTKTDGELRDLIAAARDDLVLGGVLPVRARDEADPLIKKALASYVKAEFGLDNEDSEKYRAAYASLKADLTMSTKYIRGEE